MFWMIAAIILFVILVVVVSVVLYSASHFMDGF